MTGLQRKRTLICYVPLMSIGNKVRERSGKTEKLCTKCADWKPADLSFFSNEKRGVLGLHHWCRVCLSAYNRENYDKRRTTVRKYLKDFGALPRVNKALPRTVHEILKEITRGVDDQATYKAYLITNRLTSEPYVGITARSLRHRWKQHLSDGVNGHGYLLHQAMQRDGIENFSFEYIAGAKDRRNLHLLEIQLIEQFQSLEVGYNQTRGGTAGETVGKEITVDGKTFISLNAAARHFKIPEATAVQRLKRYEWTPEQTFGLNPPPIRQPRKNSYEIEGVSYVNFTWACKAFGLSESVVRSRLKHEWNKQQAFELAPRPPRKTTGKAITVSGQSFSSLSEAATHFGIPAGKVATRLRGGLSVEQAFDLQEKPVRDVSGTPVVVEGATFASVTAASKKYGVDPSLASARIRKGWTVDQALGLAPPVPRSASVNGAEIQVAGKLFPSRALAAKSFGLDPRLVHKRLKEYGWTLNQAFEIDPPPERRSNHVKAITVHGKSFAAVIDACRAFGISFSTVHQRMDSGMTLEEALTKPSRKKKVQ